MYINIFNNISMNKNCKLLPHLNQLFLQRQSYTSHKRKIIQIRTKKPKPTIRQQLSILQSKRSSTNISLKDSQLSDKHRQLSSKQLDKMPPILQRCHSLSSSVRWMSPFQRHKHEDQLKQNQRLRKRILTSKSQFTKQKLNKQYDKFARIKQRLMKYEVNPESKKAMLKCQKRLNYLTTSSSRVNTEDMKQIIDKNQVGKPIATTKTKSRLAQLMQNRKQSNFSAFVRRTHQMRQPDTRKRLLNFQQKGKIRAKINYTSIQKNIHSYTRKLKTQASSVTLKLENSRASRAISKDPYNFSTKNKNNKSISKYFALTQI